MVILEDKNCYAFIFPTTFDTLNMNICTIQNLNTNIACQNRNYDLYKPKPDPNIFIGYVIYKYPNTNSILIHKIEFCGIMKPNTNTIQIFYKIGVDTNLKPVYRQVDINFKNIYVYRQPLKFLSQIITKSEDFVNDLQEF